MPFSIKQFNDQDMTVIRMAGDIVPGEPLAALKSFYDGTPTTKVLWDFTGVAGGPIPTDEIRSIFDYAMMNVEKRPRGRTALVAAGDHEFGMARMTTTLGELRDVPWELKVFRTLEEAVQWLGVRYPEDP